MSFDPMNFAIAAPLLALAAGALAILLLDLILPPKQAQPWWYAAAVGAVALAGYYLVPLWNQGLKGFGDGLLMDQFALAFTVVLLGAALLTVLLAAGRQEQDKSGYLALVLWAAMGMIIMAAAGNLMTIFLGLELLSLALYVAVAFDPARPIAREGALKYLVLGSVASGFVLFGFALIYGVVGSMDLGIITRSGIAAGALYFRVGVALSLVGFGFKLALVPFHAWAPDVYQSASTATTAFMSVGTKGAAFAVLARFLMAVVPPDQHGAYLLPLSVMAGLSMLFGSAVGLWQNDLKRLMAYSGIGHAGYLIMAIPGLGEAGLSAAVYYMAAYGFTAMGIFAIISLLESEGEAGAELSTFSGLYYRRPALAAVMALFMFGLTGLPPAGGFVGKFLLAKAAVGALPTVPANAWIVLIGLLLSTGISAYVYLRVVGIMFRQAAGEAGSRRAAMAGAQEAGLALPQSAVRLLILAVLAVAVLGTLWLGVLPEVGVRLLSVKLAF